MERILLDEDILNVSDKLEDDAAVVCFLGEAAACLAAREEPAMTNSLHGLYLVFQWIENDLQALQRFILDGTPLN